MTSIVHFLLLLVVLVFGMVLSRPTMQRIVINNHEWEVPNEPGWEEVIRDVVSVQERILSSCGTVVECRRVIDELRTVFHRYPVSQKFLDTYKDDAEDMLASIFKWG